MFRRRARAAAAEAGPVVLPTASVDESPRGAQPSTGGPRRRNHSRIAPASRVPGPVSEPESLAAQAASNGALDVSLLGPAADAPAARSGARGATRLSGARRGRRVDAADSSNDRASVQRDVAIATRESAVETRCSPRSARRSAATQQGVFNGLQGRDTDSEEDGIVPQAPRSGRRAARRSSQADLAGPGERPWSSGPLERGFEQVGRSATPSEHITPSVRKYLEEKYRRRPKGLVQKRLVADFDVYRPHPGNIDQAPGMHLAQLLLSSILIDAFNRPQLNASGLIRVPTVRQLAASQEPPMTLEKIGNALERSNAGYFTIEHHSARTREDILKMFQWIRMQFLDEPCFPMIIFSTGLFRAIVGVEEYRDGSLAVLAMEVTAKSTETLWNSDNPIDFRHTSSSNLFRVGPNSEVKILVGRQRLLNFRSASS